jgi:hypothetical protein
MIFLGFPLTFDCLLFPLGCPLLGIENCVLRCCCNLLESGDLLLLFGMKLTESRNLALKVVSTITELLQICDILVVAIGHKQRQTLDLSGRFSNIFPVSLLSTELISLRNEFCFELVRGTDVLEESLSTGLRVL